MKFKNALVFLLVFAVVLVSGCGGGGSEEEKPPDIIPAPVGEISEQDRALLEVNETKCNTGEEFVPKINYTWKWSEIETNFCEKYFCDATQFSIVLLKKINAYLEGDHSKENLEFDALLMREGFGGSFQRDFDTYMRKKNFLDTPSFYLNKELGKIFADKEKFVFAASEISRPGKYAVKMRLPRNASNWGVVEFGLISSEGINNPFYYLPFNGEIGVNREGYGLGYNPASNKNKVMVSEELSVPHQIPATGKFTATITKTQDFGTANAPATRGTVLKLTVETLGESRTIEFSPLLATPLLMHSKIDTSNAHSIALLYRVSEQGITEINTGDSFLVWWPLEQCTAYERSEPILDTRNTAGLEAYMVYHDLTSIPAQERANSNVYYKTIVYAPRQVTLSSLRIALGGRIQGQGSLKFKTPFATSETVLLSGDTGILHNNPNDIIQSIEQTFESIRRSEMCIQKTGNAQNLELKVYWNEQKLYERIAPQIEAAQQQCDLKERCSQETTVAEFIDNPQYLDGLIVPTGYYYTVEALLDDSSLNKYDFAAWVQIPQNTSQGPPQSVELRGYPQNAVVIPPKGNESLEGCVYTVAAVINHATGQCETRASNCNEDLPFETADYRISTDCDDNYRKIYINKDAIHPFTINIHDLWRALNNRVPSWVLHNLQEAKSFYVNSVSLYSELKIPSLPKDFCMALLKEGYESYDKGLHIPGRPWTVLTNEFGDGFSNFIEIACTHSRDNDFAPLINQTNDKGIAVKGGDFVSIEGHSSAVDISQVPDFAPPGELSKMIYTNISINPNVNTPLQEERFPIVDSFQKADGTVMSYNDGFLLYSNSYSNPGGIMDGSNCGDVLDGGQFCPDAGPCREPYNFEIDICNGNLRGRMQLIQNTNQKPLYIQKVTPFLSAEAPLDNAPFKYCLKIYSQEEV